MACARVIGQMKTTAGALQEHGPYALYAAPFPLGAKGAPAPPLLQTRAGLVSATRSMLASLVSIRTATRSSKPALAALAPPSVLQRKSLVWLGLLALLSYAWTHWLPVLVARRMEVVRAGRKLATDVNRFLDTHVREPLQGIARELFHGYQPTIDPAQVRSTRESLVRMLQDFVREAHAAGGGFGGGAEGGDPSLEDWLEQAAVGNMAQVTLAFEEQARAPLTNLLNGKLLRSLLLIMQQLRLLMEEEVEAIDSLLKRNDFNMQVTMPTLPPPEQPTPPSTLNPHHNHPNLIPTIPRAGDGDRPGVWLDRGAAAGAAQRVAADANQRRVTARPDRGHPGRGDGDRRPSHAR